MNNLEKTEKFTTLSNKIHPNKFDYRLVDYVNNKTKVNIICPIHGIFEQLPQDHIRGRGCIKCANRVTKSTNQFVQDANKVHSNIFNYGKTKYNSNLNSILQTASILDHYYSTLQYLITYKNYLD